jgi:phenylalanyl-tRNA synthetase beta chain
MVEEKGDSLMPTFTHNKKDLLQLIGRKISDENLREIINSMKPQVEKITKNEITIEYTPERPDLFGIEGLARAIKYYIGIYRGKRRYKILPPKLKVKVKKVGIRPFVGCAIVRNVKLNDVFIRSLMHIQDALTDTLGRKRKKVAIGIHDLDKIKPPIIYTAISPNAEMIPLGKNKKMTLREITEKEEKGIEYGHIIKKGKKWPVFVDKLGIFSFPPVINSERTRVTSKTKNLFLDLTATDERALNQCLNILVTNFAERGCKIESVIVECNGKKKIFPILEEEIIRTSKDFIEKLIGIKLTKKEMIRCLEKMGLSSKFKNERLEVTIPPYRVDVLHEIDVAEDVAIGYGFKNFKPEIPIVQTVGRIHPLEDFVSKLRILMIGFGLQEVMRPILSSKEKQFKKMCIKEEDYVELENPVSIEYSIPRVWILPSLLEVLSLNQHVEYPQRIFEIGDVIVVDKKEETRTKNVKKLAAAIANSKINYEELASIVDSLFSALRIKYKLKRIKHPSFIPGRVAGIFVKRKQIGVVGEIHPKVLKNWNLEMPTMAFELNANFLFELFKHPTY